METTSFSSRHLVVCVLVALLVGALTTSCEKPKKVSPSEIKAQELLAEARTALAASEFENALALVAQLRIECPRAIEARRAALNVEDSAYMLEAARDLHLNDSIRSFRKFDLDDMEKAGVRNTDSRYRAAELEIDSLNHLCDRLNQKQRFYARRMEERGDE